MVEMDAAIVARVSDTGADSSWTLGPSLNRRWRYCAV